MPRNKAKYPDRLLPSQKLRDEWRFKAQLLDDDRYETRWVEKWKQVLDQCRDQQTWDDRDLDLLQEYIEWLRKAEDHRLEAEARPYQTHAESGRVFAHPGFQQEVVARREARLVAHQLVLTPEARREAGILEEGPDDGPTGDQAGL